MTIDTSPIAPPPDVAAFLANHPAPATTPPCPLRPGIHLWIWPGGHSEGWKTAPFQIARAKRLGATGVLVQSGIGAWEWLEGMEPGELAKPVDQRRTRAQMFRDAGLQLTCAYGLDGHKPVDQVVHALVEAVVVGDAGMLDHEAQSLWENAAGRAYAIAIVEGFFAALNELLKTATDLALIDRIHRALRGEFFCDADWWEPLSHLKSPALIFWAMALYKLVQAYGSPAKDNPSECTEWMLDHARRDYPRIGIPAQYVGASEQAYRHSIEACEKLLFDGEGVICLWDVEELDAAMERMLLARAALIAAGCAPTRDGIRAFQVAHGLTADGICGPHTLAALGV